MIDDFGFSHQQIQMDRRPYVLPAHMFRNDLRILRDMEVPRRWSQLLEITSLARVFVHHFQMLVEEMLLHIYASRLVDRQLLEVAALHRIQLKFMTAKDPNPRAGRCVPVIGAMIQQRLSLVLASISRTQHQTLFDLGKSTGFDRTEWENAFVGAAACARTIMAFCMIEGCEVYFPSIHADVDLGIDLFVRWGSVELAIGVKSGIPDTGLYTAILEEPPSAGTSMYNERKALYNGVTRFNTESHGDFVPVSIRIGRSNGERYDLTLYDEDWKRLKRLLHCVWRMQAMAQEPTTLKSQRSS